jgi:hypothetical protein
MRRARWIVLSCLVLASAAMAQDGLRVAADTDSQPWARWQGRIGLGTTAPVWRAGLTDYQASGLKLGGLSLLGDYYFTSSMLGSHSVGGFRATSGVLIGARSQYWAGRADLASGNGLSISRPYPQPSQFGPDPANEAVTAPYVGLGYTGLSTRGGWALSADLGVLALTPGNAVRFGRVAGSSQPTLDDQLREMRLAPVLQLGVSYSF